ncbi:hypothetical protein ACGFJT_44370 [Actinomadura geliboluensis]|uniref:hypothetical protein n=1 Tax=Actinomadura geliboluensis TaxID=882440 RepID=UPI00371988A8
MTKNRNRKDTIRQLAADLGISHQQATRLYDEHRHPAPDLTTLRDLPYGTDDRPVNLELAARTIAARRAGCASCQDLLIDRLMDGDRVTIATIAGAVYGLLPWPGSVASSATRRWHPYAQHAHRTGTAGFALTELEAMSATDVRLLLDDALDHWAVGGLTPDQIHIVNLTDDATDDDANGDLVSYALFPGHLSGSDGRTVPMLTLQPDTSAAEREDLADRTGWPAWAMDGYPPLRTDWRLRVDIASRSLRQIVHVDAAGDDDQLLWEAPEPTTLPQDWWDLLDRAQHVVLCGPASVVLAGPSSTEPAALHAIASAGPLYAVVARVSFW